MMIETEAQTPEQIAETEDAAFEELQYELEGLDFIEASEAKLSFQSAQAATAAPLAETVGGLLSSDEIEMIAAQLPDPHVGAGNHLMTDIGAIPDKMAFKIGEAAEMVGVKQYVLRYWESEFEMLRPRKSKNNQRVYSRRDVETAMMIRKLLYEDRFSIEGARSALRQLKAQVKEEKSIKAIAQSQETAVSKLRGLVSEIHRMREIFA
jgi:DNA-binding transcriptional MerR regulator